jgi:hypothetical protein
MLREEYSYFYVISQSNFVLEIQHLCPAVLPKFLKLVSLVYARKNPDRHFRRLLNELCPPESRGPHKGPMSIANLG